MVNFWHWYAFDGCKYLYGGPEIYFLKNPYDNHYGHNGHPWLVIGVGVGAKALNFSFRGARNSKKNHRGPTARVCPRRPAIGH